MHERIHRRHQNGDLQDQHDGTHEVTHVLRVCGQRPKRRLRVAPGGNSESSVRLIRVAPGGNSGPDYFWVTFLAGDFLAAAFLAGAFFAGAFLAGAFFFAGAFLGSSMPTSLAARSPTARVCEATVPSASWVSSTAWSTEAWARADASSKPDWLRSRSRAASARSTSSLYRLVAAST